MITRQNAPNGSVSRGSLRTVLAAAGGFVVLLAAAVPSQAAAAPDTGDRMQVRRAAAQPTRSVPAPCTGTYQGDERLGPAHLAAPWQPPVGPLLAGYERTGGLAPEVFLKEYWADGGWKYPPNDGFAEVNGEADKHRSLLEPGERLDRFGSEYGRFLAPAGDPYALRSLPPQSLTTRDPAFPCNYHVYRVEKTFTVWQGRIAPWFEQPGGGQQILLDPALLPPSERPAEGERLNVRWLVRHDYLEPVAGVPEHVLAGAVAQP